MLFSEERLAISEINNAICKGFAGITGTPIFDRAHSRHRNQPDLYFSTVDGASASNCRSIRLGTMSLKEESDNEAASSQIPQQTNNYCANDQFQQKIPMKAQNTRDETTLTQSTPDKAQTMPIQAQNMPNQAQKHYP